MYVGFVRKIGWFHETGCRDEFHLVTGLVYRIRSTFFYILVVLERGRPETFPAKNASMYVCMHTGDESNCGRVKGNEFVFAKKSKTINYCCGIRDRNKYPPKKPHRTQTFLPGPPIHVC